MKLLKFLGMGSDRLGFMALVSMMGIFYYTFIHLVAEQDFKLGLPPWGIGGWGEYGRLWDFLNPYFYAQPLYAYNILIVQVLALIPQLWMVRRGILSKNLVYFNIFTSFLFRAGYSNQDVTTTVFAPLASWNPLLTVLLVLQKAAFGFSWNLSDNHWLYMKSLIGFEPFVWPYILLFFWTGFPILLWIANRFFPIQKARLCGWLERKTNLRIPIRERANKLDAAMQTVMVIALAFIVFYLTNSFINSGYLLQICHAGQTFDQCNPWVRLPWWWQ